MDLKIKLNLAAVSGLPKNVQAFLALLPAVIISILVTIFFILPKHKEVKRLKAEITKQETEIARDTAKAAKLQQLKLENEKLKIRLEELKQQLPEEKEVSGLLKQVSDLGIKSGLKILLWKPEQKRDHSSGIIYEIPVAVEMTGSYHNLGIFFSSLTKLDRIVNISDIKMGDAAHLRNEAALKISFRANTYSAIPESEIAAREAEEKTAAAKKAAGTKKEAGKE